MYCNRVMEVGFLLHVNVYAVVNIYIYVVMLVVKRVQYSSGLELRRQFASDVRLFSCY